MTWFIKMRSKVISIVIAQLHLQPADIPKCSHASSHQALHMMKRFQVTKLSLSSHMHNHACRLHVCVDLVGPHVNGCGSLQNVVCVDTRLAGACCCLIFGGV